ncbi:RNA polymerase sigma-70 factor [Mucilaginibacter mali]|uniref:RNA polymerase sigma-70 factor n=1 Tax=Mucilaginibacter mali TaxID=2740462 RepID=A0A7D4PVF8_9SPHI|nr:RNA polymerase sigma-70 factor [Mucilaginibacter mali]QKJ31043.1 RNA polymerase sigma-70 factor [Mucilaginibacter mali]
MKKLSQNELIILICEGNIKAFDQFYKQTWRPLYQVAYRATGSVDDAKDLVQNVFVNFWNIRQEIEVNRFHISYLYTALHNGIANFYKKEAVRKNGLQKVWDAHGVYEYTNEDEYLAKELAVQIDRHIDDLPEKMQQVFILSRREHLSVNDISRELNIAPRTVKNQLSNALRILRAKVGVFLSLIFIIFFK